MSEHLDRISEHLVLSRAMRKLTQSQLADKAGMTQSQISKLERGQVEDVAVSQVVKLCDTLQVDPSVFLFGTMDQMLEQLSAPAGVQLAAEALAHPAGILLGQNKITGGSVIVNRFDEASTANANMVIFGSSGSGKSYFAKHELLQQLMLGKRAIVIDPLNEYGNIAKAVSGENIVLSPDKRKGINIFDFTHAVDVIKDEAYEEKRSRQILREQTRSAISLIAVMKETATGSPINSRQEAILVRAIMQLYKNYGYDKSVTGAKGGTIPTLSDLYVLLQRTYISSRNNEPEISPHYLDLFDSLLDYIGDGALAPIFDRPTDIHLKGGGLTVITLSGFEQKHMSAVMSLATLWSAGQLFNENPDAESLLHIDESHRMMQYKASISILDDILNDARGHGVGCTLISQDLYAAYGLGEDIRRKMLNILQNCSYRILLNQPVEIEAVQAGRIFFLTEDEIQRMRRLPVGEGFLFQGRIKTEIRITPSSGLKHDIFSHELKFDLRTQEEIDEMLTSWADRLGNNDHSPEILSYPKDSEKDSEDDDDDGLDGALAKV